MIKAETILGRLLGALAILAALSGCAGSPPVRYYTLTAPEQANGPASGPVSYAIDIAPVSVPAQADQPQLMLRSGSGELTAQYSDRWSAPLPNELRNALSIAMTRQLGVPDVRRLAPAPGLPVWRVQVDVQRFDASTAGPAVIDATWRVRPLQGSGAGLLCRSRVQVPVQMLPGGADLEPVVVAEQKAVAVLATAISSVVRSQAHHTADDSAVGIAAQCIR